MSNPKDIQIISPVFNLVPHNIINEEISGIYGSTLLEELGNIIRLYEIYEKGASFITEGSNLDYMPADLKFKKCASLINKEARFLFSKKPDMWVRVPYDDTKSNNDKERALEQSNILQTLVDNVLSKSNISSKLLKAAKDCFIGKRVAYFISFNEDKGIIKISFLPSLEFIYETADDDEDELTKIVTFYTVRDSKQKTEQRVYKKKYWLENGYCWIQEAIYDGRGVMIEEITPARATKFKYIPAGVIVNDGLTGDIQGQSEVEQVMNSESWYSRLSNADMDAERQGMNPIRWTRDMSPNSTSNLSIAAGSFWDLHTNPAAADGVTGEAGVLETAMNYTSALTTTLDRIKGDMYEQLDIPDVSPSALKGVVSSGKTLKAIYWPLIVRCDEKMLVWRTALERMVNIIIDGAKLYPKSATRYQPNPIPDVEYEVTVDNQYPLPEDEAEEKQTDLAEVNAKTMSRKAYMKKWRGLTPTEAQEELDQIAMESELLENSFGGLPPTDYSNGSKDDSDEPDDEPGDQKE